MEVTMKTITKLIETGMLVTIILAASFPASAGVRCAKTTVSCGARVQDTPQDLAAHEVRNYSYPQDHSWDVRSQGANGGGAVGGR
jgi:hypothetical protein